MVIQKTSERLTYKISYLVRNLITTVKSLIIQIYLYRFYFLFLIPYNNYYGEVYKLLFVLIFGEKGKMYKRLYNTGLAILFIGLILIFLRFVSTEDFFYHNFRILSQHSSLLWIFGLLLFILGIVFTIIGAFIKEDIKTRPKTEKVQREVYSGVCPVCHQEFETTAEIIKGYYVFNCNKCNSKLRVKKLTFYPVG